MSPSQRALDRLAQLEDVGPSRDDPRYDPMWDEIDRSTIDIGGHEVSVGVRYYDREGEPLTMRQFTMLWGDLEYRFVGNDHIGPYRVSTIWLGLDHGFGSSRPVLFESMVFSEEPSYRAPSEPFTDELTGVEFPGMPGYLYHEDFDQRRYCTERQALEGHRALCDEIRLIMAATDDIDPRGAGK